MSKTTISVKRVFRSGFLNFIRNKTVSISSIAILTVTLLIIGIFFFFRGIFDYSLTQVQNKVDIKIYFKLDTPPTAISEVMAKMSSLSEVDSVTLTSSDDALTEFKVSHANDPITLEALKEVGYNPFGDMVTVIAKDTNSYESISNTLSASSNFLGNNYNTIDKINYFELKPTIDRLNNIIKWINMAGYWIALIFIIISSLIIYNTIRLSIFIFKEEISVMKLVGASNMYIRGPFLIESSIYALLSTILSTLILWPMTYWVSDRTKVFFNGLDLFKYYIDNFFSLFLLLFIVSFLLSSISSLLAMRKYLKI